MKLLDLFNGRSFESFMDIARTEMTTGDKIHIHKRDDQFVIVYETWDGNIVHTKTEFTQRSL